MKLAVIVVCLFVCTGTSYGRLSKDRMRQALSADPLFSHQRARAVPVKQNVNINLPISDLDVQPARWRPDDRPRPATSGGRIGGNGVPVQQKKTTRPVVAGKPPRQQEMILGKVAPTKISQPQPAQVPSRPPVRTQQTSVRNDRMRSNTRPTGNANAAAAVQANEPKECEFHIPSFLLPDPNPHSIGSSLKCPSFLLPGPNINPELVNLMLEHWTGIKNSGAAKLNGVKNKITQVEFEQKCLIPALRAHVLGGPGCKTRELKVYLEWLLYLRQKLFNI